LSTIAIDPGKNGGIAYSLEHGETHCVRMPPTPGDILDTLRNIRAITGPSVECYMEALVKYIPGNKQSGSSSIVYGRNYGFIEGVIQTLGIKLHSVRPQVWMKSMGLGTKGKMSKTEWKNKLKAEAQRLFPTEEVTLDTADALLILEYSRGVRRE
jgi:hypothetical protein|tara:strand:+ start:196 stop:660 length:465 start_codon:yes stop_codon:yes gene_type:complete